MVASLQEIKGIVDIKLDGTISPEKVERVRTLASAVVTTALAAKP